VSTHAPAPRSTHHASTRTQNIYWITHWLTRAYHGRHRCRWVEEPLAELGHPDRDHPGRRHDEDARGEPMVNESGHQRDGDERLAEAGVVAQYATVAARPLHTAYGAPDPLQLQAGHLVLMKAPKNTARPGRRRGCRPGPEAAEPCTLRRRRRRGPSWQLERPFARPRGRLGRAGVRPSQPAP